LKEKKVKVDIPPGFPLVPMDSVLMAQVIVNVLDNALKYSPRGGIIEVTGRIRENRLEIEVSDQGPGIPEEQLTQIFNKFFRITRADGTSGIGLGLAISKGIVEAHGGRIWAENRHGGGTKILFILPLAEPGSEGKS